jgi:hypothetical protein
VDSKRGKQGWAYFRAALALLLLAFDSFEGFSYRDNVIAYFVKPFTNDAFRYSLLYLNPYEFYKVIVDLAITSRVL